MIKNILLFIVFCFLGLGSCVMDTLERLCMVKNLSGRKVSVYFSNSEILDTSTLLHQFHKTDFAIKNNSSKEILIQNDFLIKEAYNDNTKKLYIFFLDQDSIDKYFKIPLNKTVIDKSFLQRQLVDIHNLRKSDTLFFSEKIEKIHYQLIKDL